MKNTIARLLVFSFSLFTYFGGNYNPPPADFPLTLPAGFKAETVVESLGRNRHIAVNSNGDIYVKLEIPKDKKGIIVLRKVDGIYKTVNSFGNYGGTGIAIKGGWLYASSDNAVYRYKFNGQNEIDNPDAPETIITGLVSKM